MLLTAAAVAASLIEIVLDDTATASTRCLQRRDDLMEMSHYLRDAEPLDLLALSSRHVAEQLTYIDAVRTLHYNPSFVSLLNIRCVPRPQR